MPAPPSAVAASTAAGSDGAEQQQPASQAPAISEGVQALQCMCAAHAGNLGQLAAAGGVQAVAAAISAASTEWPAEEQGLLLLAQLACREGATPAEQQAAAAAIWQSAQAQVERRCDRPGLAAVGYAAAGVPCTSGCRCAICLPARPPVACVLETSSHSAPPPPPPSAGWWRLGVLQFGPCPGSCSACCRRRAQVPPAAASTLRSCCCRAPRSCWPCCRAVTKRWAARGVGQGYSWCVRRPRRPCRPAPGPALLSVLPCSPTLGCLRSFAAG